MTIEQKVEYMKTMMNDTSIEDDTAIVYLNLASERLLNHLYPSRDEGCVVPSKYDYQTIELAIALYNQRGVEGEKAHSENGVNRTYRSVEEILKSIPRFASLPL